MPIGPTPYGHRRIVAGQEQPLRRSWIRGGVEQDEVLDSQIIWQSSSVVTPPTSIYPAYPTMPAGWSLKTTIDTTSSAGWFTLNGDLVTSGADFRNEQVEFGAGPDNDAVRITVTYDEANDQWWSGEVRANQNTAWRIPGNAIVEWYQRLGPMGSGRFPAVWFRPIGNMYPGTSGVNPNGWIPDGEMDTFEMKGKYFDTSNPEYNPTANSRFVMNAITTQNGSYTSSTSRTRNMGAIADANNIDLEDWCHFRFIFDTPVPGAESYMGLWVNGIHMGTVDRNNTGGTITPSEWDRCLGNTHDWYLRITEQYGPAEKPGVLAPGAYDPAMSGTTFMVRDIRVWERDT